MVFNSFGDSNAPFACAAAVSWSVLRDINILMSVCNTKRPLLVVWNLKRATEIPLNIKKTNNLNPQSHLKWIT